MKKFLLLLVLTYNVAAQSVVSTTVPVNTNMVLLGKGTNFFNVNSNLFATTARNYIDLPNMAALRALPITYLANGAGVNVLGYYSPGDGGGGTYVLTNTVSGTNAYGGRVLAFGGIKSWEAIVGDSVNVRQFGAKGDGTTDDQPTIQAAWNMRKGRSIFVPASLTPYVLGSTLTLTNGGGVRAMGFHGEVSADLQGGTIFSPTHTNGPAILIDGSGMDFSQFTIDYPVRPANTQTNAVAIQLRNCWNGTLKKIVILDAAVSIRTEAGYSQFSLDFEDISIYGYSVSALQCFGVGTPAIVFRRCDFRQSGNPFSSSATGVNSGTNVTLTISSASLAAQLVTNQIIQTTGFSPSEYNGLFTATSPNGVDQVTYTLPAAPSGPISGIGTIINYSMETPLEAIYVGESQYTKFEDICLEWYTGKRAAYFRELVQIDGFHLEGFNAKSGGNNSILQFSKGGEISGFDVINSSSPGGWVSTLFQVDSGKLTIDQIQYRDLKFDSPGANLLLSTGSGIQPQPKIFNNISRRWDRQSSPGPSINTTSVDPSAVFQGTGWLYQLNGARSIGDSEIPVDAGSGTLPVNSFVDIGLYPYKVTAFLPASGAITNITIFPPLAQNLLDNTAVKLRTGGVSLLPPATANQSSVLVLPTTQDRKFVFEGSSLSVRRNSDDGERVMYLQSTNQSQGLVVGTNAPGYQSIVFAVGAGDTQIQFENDIINAYVGGGAARKTLRINGGADTIIGNSASGTGLLIGGTGSSRIRALFHTTATLVAGVVTLSNTAVDANTRIFVSRKDPSTSPAIGVGFKYSINAGVSYTITSLKSDATVESSDVSTIDALVIVP